MTTITPTYATLKHRGAFDDPVTDLGLDDILARVGAAITRLGDQLDEALNPDGFSRDGDPLDASVDEVLATLDRAVVVYARLLPLVRARQAAVSAQGLRWERHLEDIDAWRDECLKRRAA